MKSGLQELVSIISENTGAPHGRVAHIARRGQDVGIFPKAVGAHIPRCGIAHVVALILALASGRPVNALADAWQIASYKSTEPGDGTTAGQYLARMLSRFRDLDPKEPGDAAQLAFKSSVTIIGGDQPALVVRVDTSDDPLEVSFTPSGQRYEPYWSQIISPAAVIPGRLLFRIGTDLADVSPFADEAQ